MINKKGYPMEQAKYKNKIITAIDVLNKNGLMIHDIRSEYKTASGNKELSCLTCGKSVVFCAGPKRKPYFSHWKGTFDSNTHPPSHESEEHREGKHVLYKYLQNSGIDKIYFDKKLDIPRWANLYIDDEDHPVIIEYIVSKGNYSAWMRKLKDYSEANKTAIWVIDKSSICNEDREIDGYSEVEYQLGELDRSKRIFVLDTENVTMTIEKYMEYSFDSNLKYRKLFQMDFDLYDIRFSLKEGFVSEAFDEAYTKEYGLFMKECDKKAYEQCESSYLPMTNLLDNINKHKPKIALYIETSAADSEALILFNKIMMTSINENEARMLLDYIKSNGINLILSTGVTKNEFKSKLFKTQSKYSKSRLREVLVEIQYAVNW